MGASYPELSTRQMLHRAGRLMEAREFAQARTEYRAIEEHSTGADRDTARVRLGALDYQAGKSPTAAFYLRPLEVATSGGRCRTPLLPGGMRPPRGRR